MALEARDLHIYSIFGSMGRGYTDFLKSTKILERKTPNYQNDGTPLMANPPGPSHSKESEMIVLGAMLSQDACFAQGVRSLELSDFYFQEHQKVFLVLKYLHQSGKPGDIHLAAEELRKHGDLHAVGGVAYLIDLAQFAGTSTHLREYIAILKEKSFVRQACHLFEEGQQVFRSNPSTPIEIVQQCYHKLQDLGKRYSAEEKSTIGQILSGERSRSTPVPLIERIEERQTYYKRHHAPFMTGVPTGFAELDRETTVLEETNLVVVAARPAMGKTAFALNIANHVSIVQNKAVALFSLEMGADQIAERFLSLRTGISGERIKRGALSDAELELLKEEEEILRSARLFLQDQQCSTIAQISSQARALKEDEGVSLFMIDYLQLLGTSGGGENRQYEVAEISRKLKLLAMELQTPFLCVSQLSRKVEERQGHRPMMSDLRDSGQIEQDSDIVMFIQRHDYYNPEEKPGMAEVIVAKNRNGGATPSLLLHFDSSCGRFSSTGTADLPAKPVKVRRRFSPERFASAATHPLLH